MEKKGKTIKSKLITPLLILLLAAVVIVIVVGRKQTEVQQLNSKNMELTNVIDERDSFVNELVNAFDSIEQNLTFVNERRNNLVLDNSEGDSFSKKDEIMKDIQLMNEMLEESKLRIEELEKKLSKSGINLRSFKNKIARLNKTIESQNIQIAELQMKVEEQHQRLVLVSQKNDSLKNEVLSYQDSLLLKESILAKKDTTIQQQIAKLNRGYYVSGTYKELFENGVVAKNGGFLGIFGKSKTIQNNFNEAYFTQVDIRENRIIPINSKKVQLISEHPENSYRLVEEDGVITQLEIEIPEDFWKITNYAVIEVK